ncbi:DNA-binding protein [archaeon]|nr:DNA-binding protein [archaeon]
MAKQMKVKDIKPKQRKIDVELTIKDFGDERSFSKFGTSGRVITALGFDDTGKICVTLWNEDVDRVKIGDKIKITNGYSSEFQGILQITSGKLGKLEVFRP